MKALSAISSLSAEEKNFVISKQLTAAYTPDEWLNLFKKLKDFDSQGDSTRTTGFRLGCVGLILTFVGIILLTVFVGVFLIVIGILLAIVSFTIYFYLKPYDMPGEILSKTLVPIVLILREEMNPQEKLKLKLDLRGFSMPEKLVNKSQSYARGNYHAIVDSYYRDHWLDGETILADGTRLIWSVEDLVKSSQKSKRNARGKHKTKTKNKHQSLISLQVGMNNKKYILPEKLKQKGAEGAIRTKDVDKYSWMRVRKMVKHQAEKTFSPADFVNVVASAYLRAVPAGGKK